MSSALAIPLKRNPRKNGVAELQVDNKFSCEKYVCLGVRSISQLLFFFISIAVHRGMRTS